MLDGNETLIALTGKSIPQLVAETSRFTHPITVGEIGTGALFRTVRNMQRRGAHDDDLRIVYDDNSSPALAFRWANNLDKKQLRHAQYNHVVAASSDPDCYTSLTNLFVTPKFVAYLTDTHKEAKILLEFRALELFGPTSPIFRSGVPKKPSGYDTLKWAEPLPPIPDILALLEKRLSCGLKKPKKNRSIQSIIKFGWNLNGCRAVRGSASDEVEREDTKT